MLSKVISERTAKLMIAVLFSLTLIAALLFAVGAQMQSSQAMTPDAVPQPTSVQQAAAASTGGERLYKPMPDIVRRQIELTEEIASLNAQLAVAQQQLAAARDETQRMANAQLEAAEGINMQYAGEFYATAYCCEEYPHICGGNGVTASGTKPMPNLTCAADWSVLPAGTWIYIEGVGLRRVEDTGSAIKGARLDIAIDTHANALRWSGQGRHHVWIMDME